MSTPILNIDLLAWDPASPVLLPLGPVTVAPIFAASMGVLIPFVIFALSIFMHMWGNWQFSLNDAMASFEHTMGGFEHRSLEDKGSWSYGGSRSRG